MNKSVLIIIAITFMGYFSYGQTSVAVYNNNNANYYQKMFTSKIVVHIIAIENWSAIDKTDDYASVLKNNPDYQKTTIATDEMLLKIAVENGDDYVCNLAIKTNLTINNITASLVNIKTGLTEQKATATCTDLVSASSLDKAAQEIVDKLISTPKKKAEENARALAEQKANEEKAKAEQKSREEKALAEQKAKEEKAIAEAEKQAKIEAEREARAIAEAEKQAKIKAEKRAKARVDSLEKDAYFDNSLFRKGGKYVFLSHTDLKKVKMSSRNCLDFLTNHCPDATNSFVKGYKLSKAGNTLITIGTLSLSVGIATGTLGFIEGIDVDYTEDKILVTTGAIVAGVGLVALIAGIPLSVKGKHYKRDAIDLYNSSCKKQNLSYIEYSFGLQSSGIGFTLQF